MDQKKNKRQKLTIKSSRPFSAYTSNHIHLLVYSTENREAIPRSIQLVAGRTGQEYNQRKNRKGAFWEDRYHAAAVDTEKHLVRCMTYIDLNMIRAGVVDHPRAWKHCGYNEIVDPSQRYRLLARDRLKQLFDAGEHFLTDNYQYWVDEYIQKCSTRGKSWTEAVAVGLSSFVE